MASSLPVTASGSWLTRARGGLAHLCCLLTLLAGAPDASLWAWSGPAELLEAGDGQERPANDENDDGKDGEAIKWRQEDLARRQAARRPPAASAGWLAHRPHEHSPAPGHPLRVCSPFERGAPLPLRC